MFNIKIKKEGENKNEWQFEVEVEENSSKTIHLVKVDKDYFSKFSARFSSAEELVRKSFEFLLKRESKESILKEFDLAVISRYFSEYEREIIKY